MDGLDLAHVHESSSDEAENKTEPAVENKTEPAVKNKTEPAVENKTEPDVEIVGATACTGGKGRVKKVPAEFQRMTGSTDFIAFRAWRDAKKKIEAGEEPMLRKYKELLQPHVDTLKKELGKMKDEIVKNANENASMLKQNSDDNTWNLAKFQEQLAIAQNCRAEQQHMQVMNALKAVGVKVDLQALAGSSNDKPAMMTDKPATVEPSAVDQSANDQSAGAVDQSAVDQSAVEQSAVDQSAVDQSAVDQSAGAVDQSAPHQLSMEELAEQVKQMKDAKRKADAEAKQKKKDDAAAAERAKLEAELAKLT